MFIRTQNGKILSSVKDYALYCTFVRAVDHFKAFTLGADGLVVLVTPEGRPVADYKRSATAYLFDDISSEEAVHVGYACISGRDKPERTKVEYEERCGDKRRAIVVSDTKSLPAFIAVAADIIIDVEPITKADLQEACQVVLDLKMTETQARQLLRFPLDLVFSALRRYRTVATSIRHLTTHAADYGRGEPIAEPHPRL
jgi:cell division protease FtsH